ncbi:MAG: DUF3570 domain-containing protein [Steroidobacteraceae bacterium]
MMGMHSYSQRSILGLAALLLLSVSITSHAGVLPEDRADMLYHVYDGGGVEVSGPSLLVRKKFGESVGVDATYDVDMVSSASINVMTAASPYKEHRTQWSSGASYLRGKTTYNVNFLNSTEKDYISDNVSFGISEDMFGDLTTVSLGFTRGWDDVKQHLVNKAAGSDTYLDKGDVQRRNYRLGLSQILTKSFIVNMDYESSALEGYLQNPYRSVRYGAANATPLSQNEIYPRTRTSNAVGLNGRYYLPYRASVKAGYRYYTDSWGIVAHTGDLEYVHPIKSAWTVEVSGRYYTQTHADFYSDLFPYINAQNFLARDKVLATFNDWSLHLGGSWRWTHTPKLASVLSLFVDHIQYNYLDFKNALVGRTPSAQPLYNYSANVYQFQYSLHY